MKRVVGIIQARLNSQRLPGKVLLPLGDETVLDVVYRRLASAERLDDILIATTNEKSDDRLAEYCKNHGFKVFRGDEKDVLSRFLGAANSLNADTIVRITADCPFVDPEIVDQSLQSFSRGEFDYFSNVIERTFPDGLDVEVFSLDALKRADLACQDIWVREHVTPFMRTGAKLPIQPGDFRVGHLHAQADYSHLRWTLDTASDYEFMTALTGLGAANMSWMDIVSLLTRNPHLLSWNRGITHRMVSSAQPKEESKRKFTKSAQHLNRALETIPVGSQTFSKSYLGWALGSAPFYAKHGSGAIITDLDDNQFIDFIMALLPVVLGYCDPYVDSAVIHQISRGVSLSLAGDLEAELSEKLVSLIPCAEMVRFGKNGSDATSAAVRLARAFTKRDEIVVCGYHGWHDWYIGTTEKNLGVPQAVRDLSHSFPFNDADGLESLLRQRGDAIAAVIIEPTGKTVPKEGFLKEVRQLCDHYGVVLVFDEVISGFRVNMGGAQAEYGVVPDLAAFGKAMANGYPISALVGRRDIMSKMENIFFSTTFGGDLASIAAALATIKKLENSNGLKVIKSTGSKLIDGFNHLLADRDVLDVLAFRGEPWWPRIDIKQSILEPRIMAALVRQEFARQGLLIASGLNLCLAHSNPEIIDQVFRRATIAIDMIAEALKDKNPSRFLSGDVVFSDFDVRGHYRPD